VLKLKGFVEASTLMVDTEEEAKTKQNTLNRFTTIPENESYYTRISMGQLDSSERTKYQHYIKCCIPLDEEYK
jgi:hypothetical protein